MGIALFLQEKRRARRVVVLIAGFRRMKRYGKGFQESAVPIEHPEAAT